MSTKKPVLALFDFDCTITTRDTLLPFLLGLHPFQKNIINSLKLVPVFAGYKTGWLDNHTAKEKLLTTFLENFSYPDLKTAALDFSQQKIPHWIKPEALNRIRWHQAQDHRCILISAGLEIYLQPWAELTGFSDVLATRLESQQDRVSGKILGRNCFAQEKVERLLVLFRMDLNALKKNYTLYAYGDSRGDKELLACADFQHYRVMPE